MATSPASQTLTSQGMLDVLIRAGLIIVLVIFSYRVFYPFLNLLLWSMILAVTMYPLHLKLKAMLGGKDGRAATLIVLLFIALLLVPIYLLGSSIAGSVQHAVGMIRGGGLHVPPPDAAVAGWPVIGDSVYALWQRASTDLAGVTEQYQPQLKAAAIGPAQQARRLRIRSPPVHRRRDPGRHLHGLGRERPPQRGARRNPRFRPGQGTPDGRAVHRHDPGRRPGRDRHRLHPDVPGRHRLHSPARAGRRLPLRGGAVSRHHPGAGHDRHHTGDRLCHLDPGRTTATIIFSVYVFVAGLADNVLKPLMLGRGVEVPMPVVLIGAIGGMVTGGIVGLFIGPVILGIAYQLFWAWVRETPAPVEPVIVPDAKATA
jgi:hypothetical protein